ncbi:sigma-54-dependent transcriptional regulator [Marinobacterium aestuariivivens]|uniref:Sigma-54-dependent transcriptional regulator n=1 Tax=Marinobacterium aestuariivivens TaxID=1698799 RepID=A0ABW2A708_9GAMM
MTDVRMPGMDGLELMHEALTRLPGLPVVLVTAHGDIDMATRAMRDGAYDFIEKPFVPERLVETLQRACDKWRLLLENHRLQQDLASRSGIDARLIGLSPPMQRLKQELQTLAAIDTSVIIYGETGTGKELVAQCLHDFGPRHRRHFVPINCGAIPESLIESELFGHEAGAFTGATKRRIGKLEYADGGTLFLDEIESMPPHLQIRLLRALQEGVIERLGGNEPIRVDLRVVAAAKTDLRTEEQFREDLYYRLNVSQLHIPALRSALTMCRCCSITMSVAVPPSTDANRAGCRSWTSRRCKATAGPAMSVNCAISRCVSPSTTAFSSASCCFPARRHCSSAGPPIRSSSRWRCRSVPSRRILSARPCSGIRAISRPCWKSSTCRVAP